MISAAFQSVLRVLPAALLLGVLLAGPAQAQRKNATANSGGRLTGKPARLQPLFGGLSPAQATQLLGKGRLQAIAASFPSPAEASAFFTANGYQYLRENQPDTATYRFNLAWLLNPQNAEAYRGLGIIASNQAAPDAAIALLSQGFGIAPGSTLLMSDLGASHLIRYGQTKKKKDLTMGLELLNRATATDPTNATAWQQLARGLYYQEKYAEAWAAVHKGQSANVSSLDFDLITDLLAKLPDPECKFN